MRLKVPIIILLILLTSQFCWALKDTTYTAGFKYLPDTTQIRILLEYSDQCDDYDILKYTDRAIIIGKKINAQNPNSKYIEYYAAAYNNEAYYYDQVGKIKESLSSNLKALKIRERIKDKHGVAESCNNLAYLFQQQGDYSTAKDYYDKAEKIFLALDDPKGLVNVYINYGYVYYLEKKYDSSQLFFEKGLKIAEEVNDTKGISYALNNLAGIYNRKGLYEKTEETYLKSLELRVQTGDKSGIARSHHNLGRLYFNHNNLKKAFYHANLSYQLAQKLKSPDIIGQSTGLLSDIYKKEKNFKEAYKYLEIYVEMKDSILSDETRKSTIKEQAKYEYEKQKVIDDKENEKQLAIAAEQKQKQKIIIYAIAGGLVLVILFSIFIFNRLQVTRKQKILIEEQKQEVEKQRHLAEHQKILVEEKNQEITDSIQYAKRIQNAILPPDKLVKEYLKESFILYKPKDIVAGDFYWMEHRDNKILFAAADCTGHGVPGAMVSVICNNALNRSVREYGLTNPGEILNKTREIVVEEFEKSEEEVQDGMDIALCVLEGNQLQYAGANNPLWIIRNGELIETKPDKQPIGKFDTPLPYTTHSIKLIKGDNLYIFSDGYVDQFGGEKGKKFKAQAFRELLLSIQHEKMEKQKMIINNSFEKWKGELEQIDDVCVIGVKV